MGNLKNIFINYINNYVTQHFVVMHTVDGCDFLSYDGCDGPDITNKGLAGYCTWDELNKIDELVSPVDISFSRYLDILYWKGDNNIENISFEDFKYYIKDSSSVYGLFLIQYGKDKYHLNLNGKNIADINDDCLMANGKIIYFIDVNKIDDFMLKISHENGFQLEETFSHYLVYINN